MTTEEVATIIAKYEGGKSMTQLKAKHEMAKRTVATVWHAAKSIN
ncbi:hypothetical protein [Nocardia sp. NPDC050793]